MTRLLFGRRARRVQYEILEAVEAGHDTATALREWLGIPTASLRQHLASMEAAGMLVRLGTRAPEGRGRAAIVWGAP